jgi:hypothetical protein
MTYNVNDGLVSRVLDEYNLRPDHIKEWNDYLKSEYNVMGSKPMLPLSPPDKMFVKVEEALQKAIKSQGSYEKK